VTDLLTTAARDAVAVVLDPLMSTANAALINEAVRTNGPYGLYAVEKSHGQLESKVAERYDAARNYIRTGGYAGVQEPPTTLIRRTGYFRSTLMQGRRVVAPGFELLNELPALFEAAHAVHDRQVIEPAILYLNLLVPGQELAIHIDVPEFAGADRSITPQWLLVVMRASGLFEDLRVPITTGITYFGDAPGGALRYYPDGPDGAPQRFEASDNTAMVIDADTIYHGVERVGAPDAAAPLDVVNGAQLHHDGNEWLMTDAEGQRIRSYDSNKVRLSISWKAYCFADESERHAFEAARGTLTIAEIERRLLDDLRLRGLIGADDAPELTDIVDLLIDTYQHFPDVVERRG
jgi:hypothetical protein